MASSTPTVANPPTSQLRKRGVATDSATIASMVVNLTGVSGERSRILRRCTCNDRDAGGEMRARVKGRGVPKNLLARVKQPGHAGAGGTAARSGR